MKKCAVIVNFHRISNDVINNPVVSCNEHQFGLFCDFFKKHFDVVPLSNLVQDIEEDSLSGKLAITFDDGYKDNYTTAAPILISKNLPACFFIVANFIGTSHQTYWDKNSGCRSEWMTWDEICQLHKQGFEIGSHTLNHLDLGKITSIEALIELEKSQQIITEKTGKKPTLLATPYGKKNNLSSRNKAMIQKIYQANFSAYGGLVTNFSDVSYIERNNLSPYYTTPYSFGLQMLLYKLRKMRKTL